MIRFKILALLVLISLSCFGQNEAEQIFIKATSRFLTTNMEMSLNQKTTDKKGRVKEKSFDVLVAKFGKEEKTKMTIHKPERAAGITIIVSKLPDEDGIIEVYTPANGKTRKMVASEKNMETVGSDFSFSNYGSKNWENLDIKLLEKNEVDDKPSYRLEVKDKKNTAGNKAELLIDQKTYSIEQIITYTKDGVKHTVTRLSDFQPIEGRKDMVQPMLIQTENMEKGQVSELQVLKITPLSNLDENEFLIEKKD
jgi:outer membrane lipoprotein-sorting protein